MALGSTVFVFDIDLSDADRQVYERLSLRVARHPSESDEFLVAHSASSTKRASSSPGGCAMPTSRR
jgi:uncharacterized protein YaeQ